MRFSLREAVCHTITGVREGRREGESGEGGRGEVGEGGRGEVGEGGRGEVGEGGRGEVAEGWRGEVGKGGTQLVVVYREVSLIQRYLVHSSMWMGLQTVSSLERCPSFRVSFIERFHCCTYPHPFSFMYVYSLGETGKAWGSR